MGSKVSSVKTYIDDHKSELQAALDKLKKKKKLESSDEAVLDGLRESAGFNEKASRKSNTESHYLKHINQALKEEDSFKGYKVSNTYSTTKRLKTEGAAGNEDCSESLTYEDDWELETPHKAKPKSKPHNSTPTPKPAKPEASRPEVEEAEPAVEEEPAEPVRRVEKTVTEEADTMNDLGGLRGSVSVREREEDDGPSPWLFALGAFGASLGSIAGCFNQGGGCYTPQPCFNGGGYPPPPRCGGGPFQIGPVYYTDGDTWPWGRMPPGINLGGGFSNGNYAGASSTASSYPYDPMAVNMARHNHNFHNT